MSHGPYRKLPDIIRELEEKGIDPDSILVNEDDVVETNPAFDDDGED